MARLVQDEAKSAVKRTLEGKPRGMRAAINAHCRGCIYDEHERVTWRQQTESCTITGCPLWPWRPRVTKPRSIAQGAKV